MSKQGVEIYLKALKVEDNGVWEEGRAGNNALTVELIHPTFGRSAVLFQNKDLEFKDGELIEFESVRDEDTGQLKYDEFDLLMFKEEILNKAKLDILLTHTEEVKDYEIILTKVFSSIINLGTALLPGVVAAMSKAMQAGALEVRKKNKIKDEKVYAIGKASRVLSLDDDELRNLKPGDSKDISINLPVPRTITQYIIKWKEPRKSPKPKREPVDVLKKSEPGTFNATLTITVKFVE